MLRLLDTSVAILLRDLEPKVTQRLSRLETLPVLSVLTVVELEGGVAASGRGRAQRRQAVDALLETLPVLPFGTREAEIYGRIVDELGFSRSKVIDRMIAAQALAVNATLVTLNRRDFRGISGLEIDDWNE